MMFLGCWNAFGEEHLNCLLFHSCLTKWPMTGLRSLVIKRKNAIRMERVGGRGLVTQGIIEPKFGGRFGVSIQNGINHVVCQKGHRSPPILQDPRHRDLEAKSLVSNMFSPTVSVQWHHCASNSVTYRQTWLVECAVVLMTVFKNSSKEFLPRAPAARPLNQGAASNKSNAGANGRKRTLDCKSTLWPFSVIVPTLGPREQLLC